MLLVAQHGQDESQGGPGKAAAVGCPHPAVGRTKFRTLTGWQPMIPFKQTLLDLLNYWRERV